MKLTTPWRPDTCDRGWSRSWRLRASGLVACLLVCTASGRAVGGANWPQFRGPGGRGVADGSAFPDTWSSTRNVRWKTPIAGRGWSSPVVWGSKLFLTTAVSAGQTEAPKKGLYFGGERPKPSEDVYQWWLYCLDVASGKVLWKRMVHSGKPATPIHVKNSYASETPVADEARVYCLFGGIGAFAFTHTGKQIWERRMPPRPMQAGWGTASSPALYGRRLYIQDDNEESSGLLCLDAITGADLWQVPRDEKSNWSSPFVWKNSLRTEIVTAGSGKVRSYDLNGKLLWWLQGMSGITISTPYAEGDRLYVTSGYVGSRRRPIYAIRPGAAGDISVADGQAPGPAFAWTQPAAAPYNTTTLLYRGIVYSLLDFGLMSAYDAATGAPHYERVRIPGGRAFTASPWAANGKVYCMDEDGVTYVIPAGREFKLLHTNSLGEDDMGMASPAAAGDSLIVRTSERVYCIGPGAARASEPRRVHVSGQGR